MRPESARADTVLSGAILPTLSASTSILRQGVDAIINFAAESHVDRSIDNARIFLETNVMGTQALLDAALRHKVRRYMQISTDEVYGSLGPTGFFTEAHPYCPQQPVFGKQGRRRSAGARIF